MGARLGPGSIFQVPEARLQIGNLSATGWYLPSWIQGALLKGWYTFLRNKYIHYVSTVIIWGSLFSHHIYIYPLPTPFPPHFLHGPSPAFSLMNLRPFCGDRWMPWVPALCKKKLQIGSGSCWECSASFGVGWDVCFLGGDVSKWVFP